MVICTKAAEPWSTRSNRKPRAAFSAAFLVGYSSRVPITLFRGARRPSGLVSRHRNTQICLPLEETSRLTPPLWIRVLCIYFLLPGDTDVTGCALEFTLLFIHLSNSEIRKRQWRREPSPNEYAGMPPSRASRINVLG